MNTRNACGVVLKMWSWKLVRLRHLVTTSVLILAKNIIALATGGPQDDLKLFKTSYEDLDILIVIKQYTHL